MDTWRDHLKRSADTVEMLTGFKRMIVGQDSFITSYNAALIPLIQDVNSSLGAACHAMVNAAIPEPLAAIQQWGKDFAALQASIESINAFLPDINKGIDKMVQHTVSTEELTGNVWEMEEEMTVEDVQDAPSRPAEMQTIVTPGLEKYLARLNQYVATHSILTGKDRYQHDLSRQLAWLPLTEMGNALRMYYRFHEVIRFVPEKGKYFVWSGRVWKEDAAESHVIEMARKTIAYLDVEATLLPLPTDDNGNLLQKPEISITSTPTPEQAAIIKKFDDRDKQVAALNKWMKSSQSKKAIDAVLWILRKLNGIPVSLLDFNAHDYLVNFPNGTLDLRTGEFRKQHNPLELHTKIMGTTFQPDAPAPYWIEKFIKKITRGDEGIARFLQQIAGEGLAGAQQDDVLPVCYGPGSNGKTVFSEILKEGYGDYADMANSDLFLTKQSEGISNDRAALVGVRFLTASETDEGRKLNEAIVKSLTGGDTQKVRFLRQEFFTYQPKFTPILFTNHKPVITGTDNGIWRRVKLVPWLHNFENDPEREDKPAVMAKMRAELPGIIAWAYRGYQDRQAAGKLFIPEVIVNDTLEYRQQSDSMGEYLEDHTVRDEEEATETVDDLYKDYKEWANDAGITSYTLSKKGFGMKLKDRTDIPFLRSVKGTGGIRLWKGIRLLKEGEEPHSLKKQEQPSQEQPAQPPQQEELPVVPTADQLANWPQDAYQYVADKEPLACRNHPTGHKVPYCSQEIDGAVWRLACNICHPEVVASKGATYTI